MRHARPDLKLLALSAIKDILIDKKLTQEELGRILMIDQPKVLRLLAGKFYGFSLLQLMKFINLLGYNIEIKNDKIGSGKVSLTLGK